MESNHCNTSCFFKRAEGDAHKGGEFHDSVRTVSVGMPQGTATQLTGQTNKCFSHIGLLGLVLIFLMVSLSGCAATRGSVIDRGVASWYGPGFHGKTTANGETYDQNAMTAAHRTLPFNTVVRVTNMENGKSVTVRINDRGPYVDNRVIDLSFAAAREIDMIDSGLAPVRLQLVRSEAPVSRRQQAEQFTVQLASFTQRRQAEEMASGIRGAWVHQARVDGTTYYRVYVGRYSNRGDAERAMTNLRRQGHEGFVKQVQN